MRIIVVSLIIVAAVVTFTAFAPQPKPPKLVCTNPACRCDDCRCEPCPCVAEVPEEPEPEPQPEPEPTPAPRPELHAWLVVKCKNPDCATHGPMVKGLAEWAPYLMILAENDATDKDAIAELHGEKPPYLVLKADGKAVASTMDIATAHDVGAWLNKEAAAFGGWPVGASNLCSAVVVTSESCPPCRALKRDKAAIEAELGAALEIVDSSAYRVDSVPTTIVYLNGREIGRESGYRGREKYLAWLRDLARAKGGKWK